MSIAAWLLATAGAALVLTQSSIAAPVREWLDRAKEDPWRCDWTHPTDVGPVAIGNGTPGALRCLRRKGHTGEAHRISAVAPQVRRRARVAAAFAKLVSCPMCSGFWLGMGAAAALGERGIVSAFAHGLGGSIVSALAVALWLALSEAQSALGLWRYLNPPPPAVPASLGPFPAYMRPAFFNVGKSWVVCPQCTENVFAGSAHSCDAWLAQGANLPTGTEAAYLNYNGESAVCGCGATVLVGQAHVLSERCRGTTSLDARRNHGR